MRRTGLIAALLAGLALGGCGTTVEDAVNDYAPTYCQKLQTCYPDGFGQAYPGGLDQCKQQFTVSYSNQDLAQKTACSSTQLSTCVKDVQSLQCSTSIEATPLPSSCQSCNWTSVSTPDASTN